MKNIGSLKEFIQLSIIDTANQRQTNRNQIKQFRTKNIKLTKHTQFDKVLQNCKANKSSSIKCQNDSLKKRSKTMSSQYQATKKYMAEPITQQVKQQKKDWKEDYYQYMHQKFKTKNLNDKTYKNKIKTPSYRGTMFPKKEYLQEICKKSRPKMDETLLRSLNKLEEIERKINNQPKDHEQILGNMNSLLEKSQKYLLKEINLYQPEIKYKCQQEHLQNLNEAMVKYYIPHSPKKQIGRKISSLKRIQYENCLSWTRKHRKNGSYYQRQLSKNISSEKIQDTHRNRQQIMKQLYKKSEQIPQKLSRKTTDNYSQRLAFHGASPQSYKNSKQKCYDITNS